MATQIHVVEWVIEATLRKSGEPKRRLAKDGTFTSEPEQTRRFTSYSKAATVADDIRTPTQVVEL